MRNRGEQGGSCQGEQEQDAYDQDHREVEQLPAHEWKAALRSPYRGDARSDGGKDAGCGPEGDDQTEDSDLAAPAREHIDLRTDGIAAD